MISTTAEYALRAVCTVARDEESNWTTEMIADSSHIPMEYLRKVLQSLSRANLVSIQRGGGGGVCLAMPADTITVLEVVNAVDPIHRIESCPLGLVEHEKDLCPLHAKLDEARKLVQEAFQTTTIAELLNPKQRTKKRCHFPFSGVG